ncbi:MAG: class I mannose-6-phosphate isomerase [Ruminococcus sp.]|nr:class I mannose-6-phosphate isomerase [Ruminococcus sp.]
MTPFLLEAPIKDYIWGGTRLREEFGKESTLERLAESWELSCHPDGTSIIASGGSKGTPLTEFLSSHPEALGKNCARFDRFPVLVKLIDARNDLSVQVHPDDAYARAHENDNGKTEMWYVLDADDGAELVYGFRDTLTQEELRAAVSDNSLMEKVNRVPVKKGDVFFITPGTLHAIGKGILIAEIQQNSNVTYRVYDYGRLGADGKPRELHVEKAIEVTKLAPPEHRYGQPERINLAGGWRTPLAECRYFRTERVDAFRGTDVGSADTFTHILVIDGEAELVGGAETLPLKKGSSVFVPAGSEAFRIKGNCSMIITTIPDIKEEK